MMCFSIVSVLVMLSIPMASYAMDEEGTSAATGVRKTGTENREKDQTQRINFAKGPFTGLPINETIWTVSVVNLKERAINELNQEKQDTHSAVVFEGILQNNLNYSNQYDKFIKKHRKLFIKKAEDSLPAGFLAGCELLDLCSYYVNGTSVEETKSKAATDFDMGCQNAFNLNDIVDDDRISMRFIDFRGKGTKKDESKPNNGAPPILIGKVDYTGEVRILETKETKNLLLFRADKSGFKNYERIKSWNILAGDAWNALLEIGLNKQKLNFSWRGSLNPIDAHYGTFTCASISEAIIRCCGIFTTNASRNSRNLCSVGNLAIVTPESLRYIFKDYIYEPSDKTIWEKLLPSLTDFQKHLPPEDQGIYNIGKKRSIIPAMGEQIREIEFQVAKQLVELAWEKTKKELFPNIKEINKNMKVEYNKFKNDLFLENFQDYEIATKCFKEALIDKKADAQFKMGVLYEGGQGIKQNFISAIKWYKEAAVQNHAEAKFNLGTIYLCGKGIPQDEKEAKKWFADYAHRDDSAIVRCIRYLFQE